MRMFLVVAAAVAFSAVTMPSVRANGPAETMVESEQVLSELMAIPGRQIPRSLLERAQGIAVIPNVIKIGFVAGARRGHGVVLVRDADGEWSLPQFVTLTGGSVGWQAGIQGTDVVLIFTTRKGVDGLMNGKFTVGVDASVAAGPVGREAAAGTDATLQSEILSYSRSRGLFVGASLEGTALEIDHDAHLFYYGTPTGALPRRVPVAAAELRHFLEDLTPKAAKIPVTAEPPVMSPRLIEGLRRSVVRSSEQLQTILTPEWKPYLALPKEMLQPGTLPPPEALKNTISRFDHVNALTEYRKLTQRAEFQTTYELLKEFEQATTTATPTLQLPPPPKDVNRN